MTEVTFEGLLRRYGSDLALVIGNGINRHANAATINSWDDLLIRLARDCVPGLKAVPPGTALTEFYDVVELKLRARVGTLQNEFCKLMADWHPFQHHETIMGWAARHRAPILTTNFDEVLARAGGCAFQFPKDPSFTAYYPWGCHFGPQLLNDPCDGFAIWHINGMARYRTSIRLGLSHYMASVQRARGWLHGRGEESLFAAKDQQGWRGAKSWMHLVFNKPLLIVGLGLAENEVFLRWLLIERAKYFSKFEHRRQPAWYVYVDDPADERQAGKLFFLESIGIKPVQAQSHAAIYESPAWQG
ncbi:MAG TPA: hypothetical protein VMG08_16130 [Allosphingosinicella sp.]|nr:hypothetical protein [Allosphingosinicella sp.]